MKRILLFTFLLFTAVALGQEYKKEWSKVLEKEADGELKQAAALTGIIYKKAKKDKNQPQIIKAFFFKVKYMQILEEDAQFKIIAEIQTNIKKAGFPANAILKSLYAEMLDKVYEKNSRRIQVNTNTQQHPADDYRQWSIQNFKNEIDEAYKESIANTDALSSIPLSKFDDIIDFAPAMHNSNRSLYDFLAECYLNNLWKDAYSGYSVYWKNKSQKLFGTTEQFLTIVPNDSLPHQARTGLKLLLEIEKHYADVNDNINLERSILRRLDYLDREIANTTKNAFYLETVSKIAKSEVNVFTYKAKLVQAQLLTKQANKKEYSDNLIQAVALYEDIIKNKAENDIAANAINLKNNIVNRTASIRTQSFSAPNTPSLAAVTFKNLDSLTVRFYKIPYHAEVYDTNFRINFITHKAPQLIKTYVMPEKHDHFSYSTEIILPALPKGSYAMVISPAGQILTDENIFAVDKVTVSQITVIKEEKDGSNINYQIVDHFSGKPIENANATIAKKENLKTDKNGKINIPLTDSSDNNNVTFNYEGDTISYKYYDRYYGSNYNELVANVKLYLDRPIYRPGQTVYFKAIATQDKNGVFSAIANTYFTVIAMNDDSDEIKKFRLKTNEFGSFSDKIELPKNMTGEFSLYVEEDEDNKALGYDEDFWDEVNFDRAEVNFQVEEYKRPTFEITFDKIKEDIRLNEMVTIKGIAKSFSGTPLSGADVKYRIERNSKRSWYESGSEQEIMKGDTITNPNGSFDIQFKAEPDSSYDPEDMPIFSYTIYADVTDINGETHSNEFSVNAGYHSLVVSAQMPLAVNAKEKVIVTLSTDNLNREFVAVAGVINIYKVAAPDRFLIERPWGEPEIQSIPEKEFIHYFPYVPYKTIHDSVIMQNPVLSTAINTGVKKEFLLDGIKNWKSGSYELVFTAKDSLGKEVSTNTRFTLKNDADTVPADKKLFDYEIKNKDYAKDGYVEIELSAGLQLYVNVMAGSDGKKLYDKYFDLNAQKKTIRIPVLKNPRTTMSLFMGYIWQNKYYCQRFSLIVPRDVETLSIETQTVNSKLIPGNNETWSFSIKGSKKQSEVLASMYDASLDKLLLDDYNSWRNGWRDLDTYNYPGGNSFYKYLISSDVTTTSFSERMKEVKQSKSNDTFYKYGFEFDNTTNTYFAYTPKSQLRKKQDYVINGTLTDSQGMPVPGVNVVINGTSEGTQSDFDGKFSIYAPKGSQVAFSYVGMETEYRNILNGNDLNITLKDDGKMLQDIVVEAYRSTTRASSNISVTTIYSKTIEGRPNANFIQTLQGQVPGISITTGSGNPGAADSIVIRGMASIDGTANPLYIIDGVPLSENEAKKITEYEIADLTVLKGDQTSLYGARALNGVVFITTKKGIEALQQVKTRKNFDETAFFYPQLKTDKDGKFSFSFTTPEALTEWKLRLLAHNKEAASGYYENTFITQKDLMIVPNMPRFLREKDTITLVAKVTNLTAEVKTGNALLQLFDAASMAPADAQMLNIQNLQPFTIPAKGNTTVQWKITVPKGMQGVQYKVLAKAGNFSDGEENILPVLTNSIMVTESIPLWVKPNSTKEYSFKDFDKSFSNQNINQIGMTLEYTSNPAWLALQSLPYLMEFEHECAEQVFSRYYANSIAAHVLNSNPKIAEVFAAWRKADKQLSKFEQNEELKSIVLSETPWILENQSSEEIKNRLALLFDLDKMKTSLGAAFTKLQNKQAASGGFPWFEGGKESSYITRHIAAGFGHLAKMEIAQDDKKAIDAMTRKAITFMDNDFIKDHNRRLSYLKKGIAYNYELPNDGIHYLYARSFYIEQYPLSDSIKKATDSYLSSMNKSTAYLKMKWLGYSLYEKGMTALIMNRYGYKDIAKKILNHLKETSSTNEEWGMYWIENKAGWNWYQAPIETQALLIEAFTEIDDDIASADAMKVWLLKNKQNKNWPTTKSTAEAVYALLMKGNDWLSVKDNTMFKLGNQKAIDEKIVENEKEAGTGYIKLQWKPEEMKPGMGTLTVENKSAVPGFGGLYWQRSYEEADKDYNPTEGVLSITKELYSKINTTEGVQLQTITIEKPLKIGDLVTVRLVINAKEDMEYLHLKDMRASAFEPVDVISARKYNGGTSYYQSTRDVATHFFFDSLNKGVYVIEYDVRVNNAGDFSNGIATIQSMYAPEFSGNSKSVRLHIN